ASRGRGGRALRSSTRCSRARRSSGSATPRSAWARDASWRWGRARRTRSRTPAAACWSCSPCGAGEGRAAPVRREVQVSGGARSVGADARAGAAAGWDEAVRRLVEERARIALGGGEQAIERQHAKGRLTARERIARLVDDEPGAFQELMTFAGWELYPEAGGAPCGGVVT